jgi:hypothetical protein
LLLTPPGEPAIMRPCIKPPDTFGAKYWAARFGVHENTIRRNLDGFLVGRSRRFTEEEVETKLGIKAAANPQRDARRTPHAMIVQNILGEWGYDVPLEEVEFAINCCSLIPDYVEKLPPDHFRQWFKGGGFLVVGIRKHRWGVGPYNSVQQMNYLLDVDFSDLFLWFTAHMERTKGKKLTRFEAAFHALYLKHFGVTK